MAAISTRFDIGDTYNIRGTDYVIAQRTPIRRGRFAGGYEIILAPLGQMKGARKTAYAMKAAVRIGSLPKGLHGASKEYDKSVVDAAIAATVDKKESIAAAKEELAEEGRAVLMPEGGTLRSADGDWRYHIDDGDQILIDYRGGIKRWEKCVGANWSTGKVAIEARGYAAGKRWIPAVQVVEVRHDPKPFLFDLTLDEAIELNGQGWVQVTRGAEFIERSMVVATTMVLAKTKGRSYDCASKTIFQDPTTQMYWRDTGSFD